MDKTTIEVKIDPPQAPRRNDFHVAPDGSLKPGLGAAPPTGDLGQLAKVAATLERVADRLSSIQRTVDGPSCEPRTEQASPRPRYGDCDKAMAPTTREGAIDQARGRIYHACEMVNMTRCRLQETARNIVGAEAPRLESGEVSTKENAATSSLSSLFMAIDHLLYQVESLRADTEHLCGAL